MTVPGGRSPVVVNVCVVLHRGGLDERRWLLTVRGAAAAHAAATVGVVGGHLEIAASATTDEPGLLEADVLENNGRREVIEETGIDLTGRDLVYLSSEAFRADAGHAVVAVTFVAEVPVGVEPVLAAPEELDAVGWWSTAELAADPRCPPWTLRLVREAESALLRR